MEKEILLKEIEMHTGLIGKEQEDESKLGFCP